MLLVVNIAVPISIANTTMTLVTFRLIYSLQFLTGNLLAKSLRKSTTTRVRQAAPLFAIKDGLNRETRFPEVCAGRANLADNANLGVKLA